MKHFKLLLILTSFLACTAPKKEFEQNSKNTITETVKTIVKTDNAPLPIGPYNQGIVVGNTLYTAGQIAIDPSTNEMVTETIEMEAKQVLGNLKAVVEAAGFDLNQVVKTTIYMTDLQDFSAVNEIYGSFFTEGNAPARVTVQVAALPKNANLEIAMVAAK